MPRPRRWENKCCRSRGDGTQLEAEKLETPHVLAYKSKAAPAETALRLVASRAIRFDEETDFHRPRIEHG